MPFQPGQSGNPSGRPKENAEVKALARKHTKDAIQALVESLKDPKARVAAATALLDRAWGKPSQDVTVRRNVDPDTISDAELAAIATGRGEPAAEAPDDPAGPDGVVH